MKKIASIFLGIACLFGIGAPLIKENDAKIVKATNYETYVDTFDIYSFPDNIGTSPAHYPLTGENSNCNYYFVTKRGSGSKIVDLNMKTQCILFQADSMNPYGVVSTNEIGYIRSVEVEFYIESGTGANPELNVYASDTPFESPQDFTFGRDEDYYAKLDKNTLKVEFNDVDYKYFGIRSPKGSTASTSYVKSIKAEWELHDFSQISDISTNLVNKIKIKKDEQFQIVASGDGGDGEYTNNKVIYKSLNTDVFTVDENGLITAVGVGKAKIRVQYGTTYELYDVYVNPYHLVSTDISLDATKLSNPADLHEGDIVCFVYESEGKVFSEFRDAHNQVGTYVECDIESNKVVSSEGVTYFYVYGDSENGFSFISNLGEVLSFEDRGGWTCLAPNKPDNKWKVIEDDGDIRVLSKTGQGVFLTFDTQYDGFDTMMGFDGEVSIYKFENSGTNTILLDDSNDGGVSPAYLFSQKFLNAFSEVCDLNGNTDLNKLKSEWNSIFNDCDEFNNLNPISILMLKNAEANPNNGDDIQKAVFLYEYIVNKYDDENKYFSNFLDRTLSKKSAIGPSHNAFDNSDDAILTIFVFGSTSLAICATALLARKKKYK